MRVCIVLCYSCGSDLFCWTELCPTSYSFTKCIFISAAFSSKLRDFDILTFVDRSLLCLMIHRRLLVDKLYIVAATIYNVRLSHSRFVTIYAKDNLRFTRLAPGKSKDSSSLFCTLNQDHYSNGHITKTCVDHRTQHSLTSHCC